MKKLIIGLLLVVFVFSYRQASAQQLKFYYYPSSNVYYDLVHKQYIYLNDGSWTTVKLLPPAVSASGRKVVIYHSGPDVWVNNAAHQKKYTIPPRGKAVGYKGTNPNKGNGKTKN
jgi:hypothetical protein